MSEKADIKVVADKIRLAVREALEGTGYELLKSNATFGGGDLNMTLRMFKGNNGQTKAETEWEQYHDLFELPKDALGKEIPYAGKTMRITGLKPNARKNNVCVMDVNSGKEFVAPSEHIKRYL